MVYVSSQTISNCWKKIGILPPNNEDEIFDDHNSVISDRYYILYNLFMLIMQVFINTIFIFSFDIEIDELDALISQLPKSDLNAHEYLHIEDEMSEGGLTDREIIDVVLNKNKEEEYMLTDEDDTTPILEKVSLTEAENATNKMIRFLYEQGPEFGEVNEELKVLR